MHKWFTLFTYTTLMVTAPIAHAAPVDKKISTTPKANKKAAQRPLLAAKGPKIPRPIHKTLNNNNPNAKKRAIKPVDKIQPRSLKKFATPKGENKRLVKKNTQTVIKQKDIVIKAIRSARSHAKFSPVAAVESTLYEPKIFSTSVLVMNEYSKGAIYQKNAHQLAPIASISKLMSAMVVLDARLAMDEPLTITQDDIDLVKKSSSRLSVGTVLTRAEMLLLALMSSENRATSALARNYPGGRAAFVQAMNRKARELGMKYTYFSEATGLSSANVSTPYDLSLMVIAAQRYPEIVQFTTSLQYSFISNKTGNLLVFRNTNSLIRDEGWDIQVSKTGYISEAGKCLVMHTLINNTPIVIVLLGSSATHIRQSDAQRIKKWIELNQLIRVNTG